MWIERAGEIKSAVVNLSCSAITTTHRRGSAPRRQLVARALRAVQSRAEIRANTGTAPIGMLQAVIGTARRAMLRIVAVAGEPVWLAYRAGV